MDEVLRQAVDDEALERLRVEGPRILHRFGLTVVLEQEPEDDTAPLVRRPDTEEFELPDEIDVDSLGEVAFRLRQTARWRERKAERPDEGVSIDELIAGSDGP